MLRPAKGPDDIVTGEKDTDQRDHAADRAVPKSVDADDATGVVVPFAPAAPFDGTFNLRVLVDTGVVEVYAQGGRAIETMQYSLQPTRLRNNLLLLRRL